MHKWRSYDPDKSGRTFARMHTRTHIHLSNIVTAMSRFTASRMHTRTHIHLSKIVTVMSRFTASGLDNKEQYSCFYSRANPKVWLYLYSIIVVSCNDIQSNFTSQHNCDVVKYVNYVKFYVDFVASNWIGGIAQD